MPCLLRGFRAKLVSSPNQRKKFLSAKEIYADGAQDERRSGRRFVIILGTSILLLFALTVGALYAIFNGKLRRNAPAQTAAPASNGAVAASESYKWKIAGALSEACTCSVPCTCNFGEGPSPHSYCYPFYSYEIRKGKIHLSLSVRCLRVSLNVSAVSLNSHYAQLLSATRHAKI